MHQNAGHQNAGRGGAREVWITGVGLVTSIGEGAAAHTAILAGRRPPAPCLDETSFTPYPVHPLAPLQLDKQIPRNSDQRQMEDWQKIGVYAAGLALDDAGLKGNAGLLDSTDLVVAAGSGERDTAVDCRILEAGAAAGGARLLAAQVLPGALRPTLFLAQLSNLLAGNISIVHHVTGSSRTFMGEEMAGLSAMENAFARVAAGQSERCLAGGALNAEREDLLLSYELGHNLWRGRYRPVGDRAEGGGGFIPGSVGAFLVFESPDSAKARGAIPYARAAAVQTARSNRAAGEAAVPPGLADILLSRGDPLRPGALAVFSGASGVEPVTASELAVLRLARARGFAGPIWVYGDLIGHAVEAHFPAGLALAALALRSGGLAPALRSSALDARDPDVSRQNGEAPASAPDQPDSILVTGVGHWGGEGWALLQSTPHHAPRHEEQGTEKEGA